MTLRTRLTAAFLLVVLVPLLVGVFLLARVVPDAVANRQQAGLQQTAGATAALLASYCDRARTTAEAAARAAAGVRPAASRAALQSLVDRSLADGVRVIDKMGRVVASAGDLPTTVVDCGAGPARASAEAFLTAQVMLRTDAGDAGTAIAAYRLDGGFLQRLADAAGGIDIARLDRRGAVVASTTTRTADVLSASREGAGRAGGRVAAQTAARTGEPFGLLLIAPLAAGPRILLLSLGLVGGAVVLATIIALLLARATTRPLEELTDAAERIADGHLDTTIPVRSRDEVGRLAATFNTMTGELRSYIGALQASRDELQAGLHRLGDTLSSTHDLDRILAVVLETAMASTQAQAGMLLLLSPDQDELVLAVGRGLEERGVSAGLRLPIGVGISGLVARTGDPVLGRVGVGPGELRVGPGEPEATSLISVPLKSSGRVIGVLDLYDRRDADGFDDGDLAMIRTFASQATVAVDNVLLHEEAQRLSTTDGLTGLWNYRYFQMTVGKEIERAARFSRPLALLMLDLDHFKNVNDTFGHQRGDAVLVELAARVRGQVRDVDTVARYGGEEVVVVLPETDEAGAVRAAERICDVVRRRCFGEPGQVPVDVTVSVGVAVFPMHGATAGALLRRADEALYDAKRAGRDTWRMAPH